MACKDETFMVKAGEFVFNISQHALGSIDMIRTSDTAFHVIKDHRSVMGKVLASDASGRKLRVEVEGHIFDIEIRDPLDQMLEQMGFSAARNKRVAEIKAPMPGLVLKTYVSEGQAAKQGDPILVLEAMKMENSIALNTDAKIKRLLVKDGQIVEKGQVLVELE